MKAKISAFALVIAILLLLLLVRRGRHETATLSDADTNASPPAASVTVVPKSDSGISSNAQTTRTPLSNIQLSPLRDKGVQIKEGLAALNDVPIAFFGKLEDQLGKPVAGATINGDIRIYNGSQSTVQHLESVSDPNGLFRLNGEHGESLYVVPHKEGYAVATSATEFKYSNMYPNHYVSDPNNPTIIKMWKLQGAEPLTTIDQHYKPVFTNGPLYFDLLTGAVVPSGGDIKVSLQRPTGIVSQRSPQDWSLHVEAVNGGLIVTSAEQARVTFAAPDTGYQSSDTIVMSTTNHWSNLAQQMYFLSSRNGQVYAKLSLSLGINANPNDPVSLTFRGIANPNSSRNWEGDQPR